MSPDATPPVERPGSTARAVRLRLLVALAALAVGAIALLIAILLVRSVLA